MTRLLEDGIITESTSPWNSPILVVPKKAGVDGEKRWRLLADFRRLNEKTIGDAHPLPDITEILDQLGQSKYFTCLDMVMGYHQIALAPGQGPQTAFSTKQGHWEYTRLLFGLKTAPATFQKLMNSELSGLTGTRCFVYRKEVNYLGHQITEYGVKPDPQKVMAMAQFPQPTTTKQLKTFCGMISYYRRFIPNCSKIVSPLYKLLKRDACFPIS